MLYTGSDLSETVQAVCFVVQSSVRNCPPQERVSRLLRALVLWRVGILAVLSTILAATARCDRSRTHVSVLR